MNTLEALRGRETVGQRELARALSAKEETVARWAEEGYLPRPMKLGRKVLFLVSEVRQALEKARVATT